MNLIVTKIWAGNWISLDSISHLWYVSLVNKSTALIKRPASKTGAVIKRMSWMEF